MPDQTLPVDPPTNTDPGAFSDMPSFPTTPIETPTVPTAGDTLPPEDSDIPPKISKVSAPKGTPKVLAAIFGILFLVGAVGVGIKLLGQKQLINQKAADCPVNQLYCGCTSSTCCVNACVNTADLPNGCNTYINAHCQQPTTPPSGGTCSNTAADDGCTGRSPGDTYCSPLNGVPLTRTCYFMNPGTSNHMCGNTIGGPCTYSTPIPSNVCQKLYYCNTSTYSCVLTSSDYDTSSHVECNGSKTCEANLASNLPGGTTNACFSSQANCLINCVRSTPTPTPTSTPTPLARQDMCKTASISPTNPTQGQSITFTSSVKDGMTANKFSYPVYNLDNLYAPDSPIDPINPKPVCVVTGGDYTGNTGGCPTGSYQLTFLDQDTTTVRQTGTRTVPYASLFVAQDVNNSNSPLTHARILSYFQLNSNPISLPVANCLVNINVAPTPTPSPSPSPTPIPPVCLNLKVYDTSWTQLTQAQLNALQPGAVVRFSVLGSPVDQITQANFTVNATVNSASQQTVSGAVTVKKPNTNEFYFEYTIKTGTTAISATAKLYSTIIGWF